MSDKTTLPPEVHGAISSENCRVEVDYFAESIDDEVFLEVRDKSVPPGVAEVIATAALTRAEARQVGQMLLDAAGDSA